MIDGSDSLPLQRDPLGILAAARRVMAQAQQVRINPQPLGQWAARLAARPLPPVTWDTDRHYFDATERTVNWLLLLDALNFSFWGDPDDRWEIEFQGQWLSGYWALAAALTRAVQEDIPLWDAATLKGLPAETLAHVFRGRGQVPLFAARLAIARRTGQGLLDRYDGWFTGALEEADHSAIALVRLLDRDFSSFHDVARYHGEPVPFYKRAQILCADLHAAFGGGGWGRFTDLDRLTIFADYKLPQVLRELEILEFSPELAARVDAREMLDPDSAEEVEVRAATVLACELLRQELQQRGRDVPAYRLDWFLWDLSQTMEMAHPHIRTRTIYY